MRWRGFEVGSVRASSKAIRRRMSWGRRHNMSSDWRRGGMGDYGIGSEGDISTVGEYSNIF